jgi:hypothetical protein
LLTAPKASCIDTISYPEYARSQVRCWACPRESRITKKNHVNPRRSKDNQDESWTTEENLGEPRKTKENPGK